MESVLIFIGQVLTALIYAGLFIMPVYVLFLFVRAFHDFFSRNKRTSKSA